MKIFLETGNGLMMTVTVSASLLLCYVLFQLLLAAAAAKHPVNPVLC